MTTNQLRSQMNTGGRPRKQLTGPVAERGGGRVDQNVSFFSLKLQQPQLVSWLYFVTWLRLVTN
jgi:hypothetical protein